MIQAAVAFELRAVSSIDFRIGLGVAWDKEDPTRAMTSSMSPGHWHGRAGEVKGTGWCPKLNSLPGAVGPGFRLFRRRFAKPPAAALLTGQAVRERAPAQERLRLVCSLFGGVPLSWQAWRRSTIGLHRCAVGGRVPWSRTAMDADPSR